jgi:KaiC/GvpD/RAD55 family RecA-like ATPase
MKPGKVTVVTALSGHGKSIFVKAMSLGQVGVERPGLFGAFEDEAPEVLEDVAAMSLGFDRDEVDEGRLQPEDAARFFEEQERVASLLKFMRHPPTDGKRVKSTITARIEWCFNEAVRVGASYVVVDLLARLFASADPAEEQRGWECFQRCAKDTGVHGVATHQQRAGDVEQRSDKRPTREGLKGSKGVLEVADTLIGVYRASLCESVEDKTLEAIVLKQRRGRWPFAVRFDFDPKRWTLKRGREVAYLRPGEDGLDGIVDRRGGRSRG